MAQKRAAKRSVKRGTKRAAKKKASTPTPKSEPTTAGWMGRLRSIDWRSLMVPIACVTSALLCGALIGAAVAGYGPGSAPEPTYDGLADEVADLACTIGDADQSRTVAGALSDVAGRIEDGEFATLADSMHAARQATRSEIPEEALEDWHQWASAVDLLLRPYHRDKILTTPSDGAAAIREVVRGLNQCAERS